MKKLLFLSAALLAALGLFLTACNEDNDVGRADYDKSPILATVNGGSVTVDEFKAQAAELPAYAAQTLSDEKARSKFLDNLISRELLVQAARKAGYGKDTEIRRAVNDYMENLMFRRYVKAEIVDKAAVTDDEVKAYFDKNKDILGSVRMSHIQVGSREEAEDVLIKYKAGESFRSLAKTYSQDKDTNKKGGDLGFLSWSAFGSPELREAAFGTPLGEVSNVVRSSFAYHIIKITDKKPAVDEDFDKLKDALKEDLLEKRKEKLFNTRIEELRAAADIKQNEEALKGLSLFNLSKEQPALDR